MARLAHVLITFAGDIGAPDEHFSYGIRFAGDGSASTPAGMKTIAEAAGAAWTAHMDDVTPADHAVTSIKASLVGADGHVVKTDLGEYIQGEDLTMRAGNLAGNQLPLQSALCVSLLSARSGPTGKGRIFLPFSRCTLESDGRIGPADQLLVRDKTRSFINALNAIANLGPAVVASSKGYHSAITTVRVGRVVDTLRSRRRDQLEEYSSVAL